MFVQAATECAGLSCTPTCWGAPLQCFAPSWANCSLVNATSCTTSGSPPAAGYSSDSPGNLAAIFYTGGGLVLVSLLISAFFICHRPRPSLNHGALEVGSGATAERNTAVEPLLIEHPKNNGGANRR